MAHGRDAACCEFSISLFALVWRIVERFACCNRRVLSSPPASVSGLRQSACFNGHTFQTEIKQ